MKASDFIKVALIDQMQQIADLGLWFHLSRLIPPGVELLGIVVYGMDGGDYSDQDYLNRLARAIYGDFFPEVYNFYPTNKTFYSPSPDLFLTSDDGELNNHEFTPRPRIDENGNKIIYVPQWFEDFKYACKAVLIEIQNGKIEDVEVLKTLENDN